MRIKHHVYGEVDGVEKKVDIDGVARSWKKKVNGCYMTWLAIDDWEEVVEPKFVDAMEDVVATSEGHLQLWKDGQISHSFFPKGWAFEKTALYRLYPRYKAELRFPGVPHELFDLLYGNLQYCLIVKRKVYGS